MMEEIMSLALWLYSFWMALFILVVEILIGKQEVHIEGPWQWSAATFTKRFPLDHWFSKFYRTIVGPDKWATHYHLYSNGVWLMIFFMVASYLPFYNYLAGVKSLVPAGAILVMAFNSFITFVVVEDYAWFLFHPYFGPSRHCPDYAPAAQRFVGKFQFTYLLGLGVTVVLAIITAWITARWEILQVWLITLGLTILFTFVFLRWWVKSIPRKPLKPRWWKGINFIVIERCSYPEADPNPAPPNTEAKAWYIPDQVMAELIQTGKAIPLDQAISQ